MALVSNDVLIAPSNAQHLAKILEDAKSDTIAFVESETHLVDLRVVALRGGNSEAAVGVVSDCTNRATFAQRLLAASTTQPRAISTVLKTAASPPNATLQPFEETGLNRTANDCRHLMGTILSSWSPSE